MSSNCFSHLNGYEVKDKEARTALNNLNTAVETLQTNALKTVTFYVKYGTADGSAAAHAYFTVTLKATTPILNTAAWLFKVLAYMKPDTTLSTNGICCSGYYIDSSNVTNVNTMEGKILAPIVSISSGGSDVIFSIINNTTLKQEKITVTNVSLIKVYSKVSEVF